MKNDLEKAKPTQDDETQQNKRPVEENPPQEIGGPSGPEPTRYGDWERKGRCVDF